MALNINGTTGISGVDGSVSAPALTGTDSNTGITFPSADTIKFSTGGVERMSITNSGVTGTGVGGKIKQFKYAQTAALIETTSTSFQDWSALDVAITPTSSSNLLYANLVVNANVYEQSGSDAHAVVGLTDDDASSYLFRNEFRTYDYGGSGLYIQTTGGGGNHVKTAGNTNARTYKVKFRLVSGDKVVFNTYGVAANRGNSILGVWEIEP